jgi:predicted TIM-barrel fold metal-dependent hydrolase
MAQVESENLPLVDAHTHLIAKSSPKLFNIPGVTSAQRKYLSYYGSPAQLLEYLDKSSVEMAVILPLENMEREAISSTPSVLRISKRNPAQLIPFCCLDPRTPRVANKIASYVKRGCKGYGEHKVSLPIDHERSREIYKACNKLQVPIVIHFGSLLAYDHFNPGLSRFGKIALDYPEVTFVAHGPGWWREISATVPRSDAYPSGRILAGGLADRILEKYRNVHADFAGTSGLNALTRNPPFMRGFIQRYQDKLHYGTDYPFFLLDAIHGETSTTVPFGLDRRHLTALKNLHIDKRAKQRIGRDNTLRILDLA